MKYFTDQNGSKRGPYENECLIFSNSKMKFYKQLEWKKQMKNIVSFVQFPCSLPELCSLNCIKKCIFCNFLLTPARNLSLLKQFTYMHLKGRVTHLQKTNDHSFFIYFFGSNCLQHSFLYLKIVKTHFPLQSIQVCNILQFWAKATNSNSSSYFSRKQTH